MAEKTQAGGLTLREERAQVTRRRIADAAATLFADDGYGATTLRAVAARAGVAVQTVYAVYGSKVGILEDLRQRVVHDPEAEALFSAALVEPRAHRRVALFAQSIRTRWERGAAIVLINRDAGLTDATIRASVDQVLQRRRRGLASLAEALAPDLVSGMTTQRAAAVLDALTLPEVWMELVETQGWTADEYEAWLRQIVGQQLLGSVAVADRVDDPREAGRQTEHQPFDILAKW